MKRKTVQFLIDQSNKKRLEVAKRLAQANKALSDANTQMKTLEDYRSRCKDSVSKSAEVKAVPIARIRNTFAFVEKIDDAIDEQANAIKIANVRVNRTQAQIINVDKEVKKFSTLMERINEAEIKKELKTDQKLNDEFAARAYRRQTLAKAEEVAS